MGRGLSENKYASDTGTEVLYGQHRRQRSAASYYLVPEREEIKLEINEALLAYLEEQGYSQTVQALRSRQQAAKRKLNLKVHLIGADNSEQMIVNGQEVEVANDQTTLWISHPWLQEPVFDDTSAHYDFPVPARFFKLDKG